MHASLSPIEEHEELIKLLEKLGNSKPEYPQELLAARRAIFIAQVEQWEKLTSTPNLVQRMRVLSFRMIELLFYECPGGTPATVGARWQFCVFFKKRPCCFACFCPALHLCFT